VAGYRVQDHFSTEPKIVKVAKLTKVYIVVQ